MDIVATVERSLRPSNETSPRTHLCREPASSAPPAPRTPIHPTTVDHIAAATTTAYPSAASCHRFPLDAATSTKRHALDATLDSSCPWHGIATVPVNRASRNLSVYGPEGRGRHLQAEWPHITHCDVGCTVWTAWVRGALAWPDPSRHRRRRRLPHACGARQGWSPRC